MVSYRHTVCVWLDIPARTVKYRSTRALQVLAAKRDTARQTVRRKMVTRASAFLVTRATETSVRR